jgi:O-antigen ligase
MTADDRVRRRFSLFATVIFAASLFAKTFFFAGSEPVAINYALTTLSLALAAALLLPRIAEIPFDRVAGGILLVAVAWTGFSGFESGITLNLVAVLTFAIAAFGFGFILPALVFVGRREPTIMIRNVLSVLSVGSILLLVLAPDLAIDPDSGRIAGAYVSVAVASSMFGFAAILTLRSALIAQRRALVWLWGGVSAISFILLYLTRTRSSLVEVLVTALVIVSFTPLSRGLRLVVMSFTGLLLVAATAGAAVVSTGVLAIDDQLAEFRLADRSLSDSRQGIWTFGIERIAAQPLFGEGLLAKQTQGGTATVDFSRPSSYDPRYDPHSLILSFGVEGGIPFMILMTGLFILIPARFVYAFGWRLALQTPEFVIVTARLLVSIFAGGDMTTLGNIVEKTIWILLGTMMLKAELKLRGNSTNGVASAWPSRGIPPAMSGGGHP